MKIQRCARCVMDNASDDSITFDEKGYCSYCNNIEKRLPLEYHPENGEKKIKEVFESIKTECAGDPYDCMIGVSGGLDSSYIMYLAHKYGLRILAVHIDDGLDNPIAVSNINKLVNATGATYIAIKPEMDEYADIIYAMLKASVVSLANGQDNLIWKALQEYGESNHIKYILDGNNFAHEGILERTRWASINSHDNKFIEAVHRKYGRVPLKKTKFMTLTERYIGRKLNKSFKHIRPLNEIDYNMEDAIKTLHDFCGFEYYGGKHYESILTIFMQCYYLPVKFGFDKRKSHFSSLIMSGQMSREDALKRLEAPLYPSDEMLNSDKAFIADYLSITVEELDELVAQPPRRDVEYPHSILNELAPIARKFRRILE